MLVVLLGVAAAVHAGEAPESGVAPPRTLQEARERLLHLRHVELPTLSDGEEIRRATLESGQALLAFSELLVAEVERGELDRVDYVRLFHPMAITHAESWAFGGFAELHPAHAAGGPQELARRMLSSGWFDLVEGTEYEIDTLASQAWIFEREGSLAPAAGVLARAVDHPQFLASPAADTRARHVALLRRLAGLYERRMEVIAPGSPAGITLFREEAVESWDAYFEAGRRYCAFSGSAEELLADWRRFEELAAAEGWAIPGRRARRRRIEEAARRLDSGTYAEWAPERDTSRCFADPAERKARERTYRAETAETLRRNLEQSGFTWPFVLCIATPRMPEGELSRCPERAVPAPGPAAPCGCASPPV